MAHSIGHRPAADKRAGWARSEKAPIPRPAGEAASDGWAAAAEAIGITAFLALQLWKVPPWVVVIGIALATETLASVPLLVEQSQTTYDNPGGGNLTNLR